MADENKTQNQIYNHALKDYKDKSKDLETARKLSCKYLTTKQKGLKITQDEQNCRVKNQIINGLIRTIMKKIMD